MATSTLDARLRHPYPSGVAVPEPTPIAMIDDTDTPPEPGSGGRRTRFRDRWRDGWQHSQGSSRQHERIDWATVQAARGETHAGRV
jgi:hypothetical protein